MIAHNRFNPMALALMAALLLAAVPMAAQDEGESLETWQARLTGNRVTQTKNRGPARLDIHFCEGERFIATFGFPDAPEGSDAAAMTERREGDWRVRKIGKDTGVEFVYDDGDTTKHAIARKDDALFVDNVEWTSSKSELCP